MLERTLDVIRDVVSGVRHRIKSPWGSAFITSWLIFNWKPVYYILSSDESSIDKIAHIENTYSDLFVTLFCPLAWSIAFCLIYPILLNITSLFWLVSQKYGDHFHIKFLNKTTYMTRQEGDEYLRQINDLNEKNEFLKKNTIESDRALKEEINQLRMKIENADIDDSSILPAATVNTSLPSQEESRSILEIKSELLHTESGRFYLRSFLAEKLNLEQDYDPHKADLDLNFDLIKQCIESYPEVWVSKTIQIANRRYEHLKVNGELRRLEKFGLLDTNFIDDKRVDAKLSLKAQEELIELIKGVK
ncbi:MAG: hypothetical protein ABJE79_14310 [Marinomonas sp.]